jgi:maltooligosyltrehalose trehalohydrolase
MTVFRVWAPHAESVELDVDGTGRRMERAEPAGWWERNVPEARHGTDYAYVANGGEPLPDPRSRWQPKGVHEPSRVYDHDRFAWADDGWPGRGLPGAVLYELHVGTYTPEGTFDAAAAKLGHLVDLGITHVEVMPVAAFNGRHGWGYDGVSLYAVHEPYGGPDGLKRFVDACHARGLGVVLDVVYNHLGPSGNYLPMFGPYFTELHHTPWGAAVNLDDAGSDEVRRFVLDNALQWLRDFHVDGLRLDAVHALRDDRALHLLEELAVAVDELAVQTDRPLFVVAESDRNDPRTVTPVGEGGYGLTAQWDDDVHHALHALLTGERQGYYGDFGSYAALAKTLTKAFFHDGTWSSFRGRTHGRPVDVSRVPAYRFVTFLQNHDQVGNRAVGDRLSAALSPGLLKIGAALLLTSPFTPMLFMGEEWGASTPWQYFTDHGEPELAEAVRSGRRREFARHGWRPEEIADPQSADTLARSRLDWTELERAPHAGLLEWYRGLIALRRTRPELTDPRLGSVRVAYDERARWLVVTRDSLRVVANLGETGQSVPLEGRATQLLAASDEDVRLSGGTATLGPQSVAVIDVAEV